MVKTVKTSHGSLSMPVLQGAHEKGETPWRVSPPDPWWPLGPFSMAAPSSPRPGLSGRGGKSNLRSSSARSFRGFGPRLVSAMASEPKNATCWRPVLQLWLFLGYVQGLIQISWPPLVKLCQTNTCGVAIPVGAGCFLGSGSGWHPKSAGPNPI